MFDYFQIEKQKTDFKKKFKHSQEMKMMIKSSIIVQQGYTAALFFPSEEYVAISCSGTGLRAEERRPSRAEAGPEREAQGREEAGEARLPAPSPRLRTLLGSHLSAAIAPRALLPKPPPPHSWPRGERPRLQTEARAPCSGAKW